MAITGLIKGLSTEGKALPIHLLVRSNRQLKKHMLLFTSTVLFHCEFANQPTRIAFIQCAD
jgi:hypothetical protein